MTQAYCGIIMPISSIGECTSSHWLDVKLILGEAIEKAGYTPRIVSLGEEVSIIHERIVKNIYSDEIVVCDVSCKNANVMFELGLRLAFDKPVIIVKDDVTDYSFDTGPIEHLTYPRSLRFSQINSFKEELTGKIRATVKAKNDNPNFSPFLSSFGPLKSAKFDTQEVSSQELIIDYLNKISTRLDALESGRGNSSSRAVKPTAIGPRGTMMLKTRSNINNKAKSDIVHYVVDIPGVFDVKFNDNGRYTEIELSIDQMSEEDRRLLATNVISIANRTSLSDSSE